MGVHQEEVTLQCRSGGALFVLNNSTLMQYPLNDAAEQQVKKGHQRAQPLEVLLLDDPAEPGKNEPGAVYRTRREAVR